jgi:ketosteroid isomerase-like protein
MKRLAGLCLALCVSGAAAQSARTPAETVDAFHAALRSRDKAAALSLLDRALVVYESGSVDQSAEAYAAHHLARDMELAATTGWKLLTRRSGGEGDERWVLSRYRITGKRSDGTSFDQNMLETAILRRSDGRFRIVHFHWSTR